MWRIEQTLDPVGDAVEIVFYPAAYGETRDLHKSLSVDMGHFCTKLTLCSASAQRHSSVLYLFLTFFILYHILICIYFRQYIFMCILEYRIEQTLDGNAKMSIHSKMCIKNVSAQLSTIKIVSDNMEILACASKKSCDFVQ